MDAGHVARSCARSHGGTATAVQHRARRAYTVARAAVAIVLGGILTTVAMGATAPSAAAAAPRHRIISTSGITHSDVGDLSRSPFWEDGMPQAINASWRTATHDVIGRIAAENPVAVLYQGDMVQGHWGEDVDDAGVFGPVDTRAQRRAAVQAAADTFYPQNAAWWRARGLNPMFGIGDHEMGGYPWFTGARGSTGHEQFFTFRRAWGEHFTNAGRRYAMRPRGTVWEATVFARRIGPVGIVSVDPFVRTKDRVRVRIARAQMDWVRSRLRRFTNNGVTWLIVQCEIPAIGPNRRNNTSATLLENGRAFWRMLERENVDLLLTAEFHAPTVHSRPGGRTPAQIVHGRRLTQAEAGWLTIDVHDNRLRLRLRDIEGRVTRWTPRLWSTRSARPPNRIDMSAQTTTIGSMTVRRDGRLVNRTGDLREGTEL